MTEILNNIISMLKTLLEGLIMSPGFFARKRHLTISASVTSLAITGTTTLDLKIPSESAVVITKILAKSTGTFTAKFFRSDDGKYLNDAAVSNSLLFGTAAAPSNGMDPQYMQASSMLRAEIYNDSGALNTIELVAFATYVD
jgi:hypothetical protein